MGHNFRLETCRPIFFVLGVVNHRQTASEVDRIFKTEDTINVLPQQTFHDCNRPSFNLVILENFKTFSFSFFFSFPSVYISVRPRRLLFLLFPVFH